MCSSPCVCKPAPFETLAAICGLRNRPPVTAPIPRETLVWMKVTIKRQRQQHLTPAVTDEEYYVSVVPELSAHLVSVCVAFLTKSMWRTNRVSHRHPSVLTPVQQSFLLWSLTTLTPSAARRVRVTNKCILISGFASSYWGYFCKTENRNGTSQQWASGFEAPLSLSNGPCDGTLTVM